MATSSIGFAALVFAVVLSADLQAAAPPLQTVNLRDFGAMGDGRADDSEAIRKAMAASSGKRLYVPPGRYLVNSPVDLPSAVVVEGDGEKSAFVCNSPSGQFTATGKSDITFRNVMFTTAGVNTFVPTFTSSERILIDRVVFRAKLASGQLGSTTLRTYGSTGLTVLSSRFYDADSFIYLDKSGTKPTDQVVIRGSHFEHTVVGITNNPTGIYQFHADRVLVESNTFRNIVAGGKEPISGYGVYAGDGSSRSTIVRNNNATSTVRDRKFTFVQDAQSAESVATGNRFEAPPGSGSVFYQGGTPNGTVSVTDNRIRQGNIMILGGRNPGVALKEATIQGNEILKVEHPASAIWVGVTGAYYVAHATIRNNRVLETYASALYLAECASADVTGNRFLNPNSSNGYKGHTESVYVDAISWGGSQPPRGRITGNTIANASKEGSRGYARYGVHIEHASNQVSASENAISGMVAGAYHQVGSIR